MPGSSAIQEVEEKPMVPVFTVIKNGAFLKIIFVINPPFSSEEVVWPFDPMDDQVLIVGRHPDCNIMLTHPSISRFHLKILSNPTSRKFSVVDLSSVHGTWISDSRIDPGVLVELNEGDTIRVGGSSRVYRLHWIPLTRAYDCESPSVSAMDLAVIKDKEEENEANEDVVLGEANQDDYDEVVESAKSTETKNAQAIGEDEEISQNKDFSVAKGISKNSADLTLEDSIASLALHDLVKIGNSTEFLIPVKGNLSVDPFQIYSETNLDNPAHMSLCLSLEDPSSTDNQMCNEEQNKQGTLESENLRGHLAAATCEGNKNAFLGNQWTDSLSRFSPSLEALACSFSPATPSETWNPQSGEPDITFLTCVAAVETAEVGGNEKHSEWSQSLGQFSPSLEAFAHSRSTITPIEIGSPHSGKQEVMLLPWTAFEPLLQKENCNHSTKWTSHPALARRCSHETEDTSTAADTFIIGGSQTHSGNQNGVLRDHTGGHSRTSKRISTAESDVIVKVTHQHSNEENEKPESSSVKRWLFSDREKETSNLKSSPPKSNIWSRRCKPAAVLQLQTGKSRSKAKSAALDQHENEKQHQDKKENEAIKWDCSANSGEEEEEIFTPDKENITPNTRLVRSLHKIGKKGSGEEEGEEEIFTPDKENMTSNRWLLRSLHKIGNTKSGGRGEEEEEEEEEIFTPDKENMTPNTRLLKSLNKISNMKNGEFMHSNSIKRRSPSRLSCLGNITTDGNILSLEKERETLKVLRKQGTPKLQSGYHHLLGITGTRKKTARTPFQCFQVSSCNHHASTSLQDTRERNSSIYKKQITRNTFSDTCPNTDDGQRMNWTMVVDVISFLEKESRKSLQLLRGLKGTQLMIPRMVMRELESLKQRSSLFRRATYISSLLEWIEVCMVTTPWWIHIQTKLEEERSIAPTPLASPCSAKISVWGNQCEVNSPAAEDHILEYAISLTKTQVDKRIIIISNDVALKIKAMAEGMICETAQEFQTSLGNPFSDRFMWRNSTARGQTWSGAQDEVLREIYHWGPSKKKQSIGEGARGLKLILLHNSQFGKQISLN